MVMTLNCRNWRDSSSNEELLSTAKGDLQSGTDLRAALKASIVEMLSQKGDSALNLPADPAVDGDPSVVLIVGVNGAGKTTTVGKLAHMLASTGAQVMLSSGDMFRAAAYEQLGVWANRAGVTMGPWTEGATPQKVLTDSVRAAQAGGTDIVLCDTSGRLHTNWRLMDELQAIEQDLKSTQQGAPHETLLVLDGSTGLNMLNQAKEFSEAVGITGIVLTKLDGSARGGAVVSVVDQLGIPVKFIGVGEKIEDLQMFDCVSFVDSLFPDSGRTVRDIADVAV